MKGMTWVSFAEDLRTELRQSAEEGREIGGYRKRAEKILDMEPGEEKETLAGKLFDELGRLPVRDGFAYREPFSLDEIRELRDKETVFAGRIRRGREELFDRIYGGWLGRCCGCLLGKPVEGWERSRILDLFKSKGNYPPKGYLGEADGMPEDDDTNYTVLNLVLMETSGYDFTPEDAALMWLSNLPFTHVCTAERAAYRNLIRLIDPPRSAVYRNPYREWIGAQIRADLFGYVTPGDPERGAGLAWRDASISHVKNGIYGEMFAAAMISAAFVLDDAEAVIRAGLSQIPETSRLYEAIMRVIGWKDAGEGAEQIVRRIHELYDEKNPHDWCHTIPNAMIVCTALLFGGNDLGSVIGTAVSAGFDTDCNGATAGSVMGVMLGADSLPEAWTKPLNDCLKSGVHGFGTVKLSDMAKRTLALIADTHQ